MVNLIPSSMLQPSPLLTRHPSPTPSTAIVPRSAHVKRRAVRSQGKRHKDKGDKGINTRRKRDGQDGVPRKRKHTPRKSAVTESHSREEEANPLPTPSDIDNLKSIASSDCLCCNGFDYSASNFLCFAPEQSTFMAHGLGIISHAQSGVVLLSMTQEIAEKNPIPRLPHSFLLSLHVLYLTFTRDHTYDLFIEHFIQAVHLYRGVRTLAALNYSLAVDSPLGPFLAMGYDAGVSEPTRTECTRLVEFIDSGFDIHATLTGEQRALTAVVYPALLTEEYITTLRKCRLETIVTLAHDGILLHLCRHVWVIGDAGEFLIGLIARRLGPWWHEALKWPLEVVASEVYPS
ncbi:uncharacterized protein NECHADRAFT_77293 [Fusarium vanettenii 77-13-4]|uniref:Uncharacterized protein n=1 Tax=Fusarium vanettenii (strain ATCC MYA-4622 / CBS 123669 / FGSC 9596 / NRRL 45880 / 77-13-4) TaxID=660122 RepID=C7YKU0_FUSV7|nr:uncharacterized protein NECHADRAFT_77293 [Fusarium vanettenii 77-13-4]EEU46676.1 hypothetical protein NECHADRAFT_77293 [Fusarium vanettenii 77-13-4]